MMRISVVIPVYNAQKYVGKAVLSALNQSEVSEVILVEDASPDDSLIVCKKISEIYENVSLFRHPENQNLGAASSRNLGINKAKSEYIAFLDADDYYLPNRFSSTKKVFQKHPDADGVYEAVGVAFDDESVKQKWFSTRDLTITTLRKVVKPENLFHLLLSGKSGGFHTDGLVIKKSILRKTGLFNPLLRMRQDTNLWMKLAAIGRLYPGNIQEPVSMRLIHANNRVVDPNLAEFSYYGNLHWKDLYSWAKKQSLPLGKKILILKFYFHNPYLSSMKIGRLERLKLLIRLLKGDCK